MRQATKSKILCSLVIILVVCCLAWTAGGTFGVSSGGGSEGCAGGSDGAIGTSTTNASITTEATTSAFWSPYTPSEDGTVTYGHVRITYLAAGCTVNLALWDSSTGARLIDSTAQAGAGGVNTQYNFALDEAYCLVTGTTYLVGFVIAGDDYDVTFQQYDGSIDSMKWDGATGGDTVSNLTLGSATTLESGEQLTVWFDNSAT